MKKFIFILFLFCTFFGMAQDKAPGGDTLKVVKSIGTYLNALDSVLWIYTGTVTGWVEMGAARRTNWRVKMPVGQDSILYPLHKGDTLRLTGFKLKNDSVVNPGYATNFKLTKYVQLKDTTTNLKGYTTFYKGSLMKLKSDSVLNPGYATNFKLLAYKLKADSILNTGYASRFAVTGLARNAVSLTTTGTSGAATYSPTTGVFNIPQYSGGSGMVWPTGSGIPIVVSGTSWGTTITNNATNWDKYNQWDGGSTGLIATTGRNSLGGTTVGQNYFTLTNPSAVTFPRMNLDNTVTALSATDFRTAIGAGTSSTVGTVTSVGGTGTISGITLSGSVTSSGNLTLGGTLSVGGSDFGSQTAKYFLAAPNASAGNPSFRAIVASDIPTLNQNTSGSAGSVGASVTFNNGGTGDASGTAFNGSAARTISYNTVGAQVAGTYAAGTHSHGGISSTGTLGSAANIPLITGTAGLIQAGSFGSAVNTFAQGNDTRFISTFTATGSSGAASFSGGTLNIPNYTLAGLGGIGLTSLSSTVTGITYTNTTGVFSLTGGYTIPTSTQVGNIHASGSDNQTSIVGITGTLAQFNTAMTDADFVTGTPWTGMGYVTGTPWTGYGYITGYTETDPTIYAWAKATTKPTYNTNELTNGAGFITGYTETDPNIYTWARAASKPSYTYTEVGAAASGHNHTGVYIASETDPTIYAWAKAASKPSYSASDVGALSTGGGTLSGPLSGTSASFSSSVSASDFCNSDIRLKNLMGTFSSTEFNKATKIPFHKYTFKSDTTNTTRYGFVAQEVEKEFPEMIHTDEKGMKSVNYIDMLVVIVAQQKDAIERLEKRIKILENEK